MAVTTAVFCCGFHLNTGRYSAVCFVGFSVLEWELEVGPSGLDYRVGWGFFFWGGGLFFFFVFFWFVFSPFTNIFTVELGPLIVFLDIAFYFSNFFLGGTFFKHCIKFLAIEANLLKFLEPLQY